MKKCAKCNEVKEFSEYYISYGKPRSYCKPCFVEYSIEHQRKNRDRYRARKRRYEKENRDHLKEIRARWRKENPDKARAIWNRGHQKRREARDASRALMQKPTNKQCFKCKEFKEFSEFNKSRHKSDGLATYCRQCAKNKLKEFFSSNKERASGYARRYRKNNRAVINEYKAKDRLIRRKLSVPKWANLMAIKEIYEEAARRTMESGIPHEVDHVIPLKNPLVCGLHVETNLQILTESENVKKRNSFSII